MKTLADTVSKRDEYTVYGEHIANKLRNSGRSRLEIASAQNAIDNICFKLLMGEYSKIHSIASSSVASSIIALDSPQLSISSSSATSPTSPQLATVSESMRQATEFQQSNGLLCISSQQTANTNFVLDNRQAAHDQQVYENEEEYANNIHLHQSTDLEQSNEAQNLRMYYDNTKNFMDL